MRLIMIIFMSAFALSAQAEVTPEKKEGLINITLKKLDRTDKDSALMRGRFTVENKNEFPIKDIRVLCVSTGNSGSIISGYPLILYEIITSKTTRKLPEIQIGIVPEQAANILCDVTDFQKS